MTDRTVTIGFAVFCMACESPIRPTERGDFTGDTNYCPGCEREEETACGISISSDFRDELQWTYHEMRKHADLVSKVLFGKFGPPKEL